MTDPTATISSEASIADDVTIGAHVVNRAARHHRDALGQIERDLGDHPETRQLVAFVRASKRGVIR